MNKNKNKNEKNNGLDLTFCHQTRFDFTKKHHEPASYLDPSKKSPSSKPIILLNLLCSMPSPLISSLLNASLKYVTASLVAQSVLSALWAAAGTSPGEHRLYQLVLRLNQSQASAILNIAEFCGNNDLRAAAEALATSLG